MIKAVLFDMGGTVENAQQNAETREACTRAMAAYLRKQNLYPEGVAEGEFSRIIFEGYARYKEWSMETGRELTPFEVWRDYIFAPWIERGAVDLVRLRAVSDTLCFLYEVEGYRRTLRPDALPALEALRQAGYRLAVISNTVAYTQVPYTLKKYKMTDYFERVLLSSEAGFRKPHPVLFQVLLAEMGLKPEEACYVGDTITRDVLGSRQAGLALSFRIESGLSQNADRDYRGEDEADYVISALTEIPEILEAYNRSLSAEPVREEAAR